MLTQTSIRTYLSCAAAAAFIAVGGISVAHAESATTTKTYMSTTSVPAQVQVQEDGSKIISHTEIDTYKDVEQYTATVKALPMRVSDIDKNGDQQISLFELADHLFDAYDNDDNGMLVPEEYQGDALFASSPVELTTVDVTFKDVDPSLGNEKFSYQHFFEYTGFGALNVKDGMTAQEFTARPFVTVDRNEDMVIDRNEWRKAYIETKIPLIDRTSMR